MRKVLLSAAAATAFFAQPASAAYLLEFTFTGSAGPGQLKLYVYDGIRDVQVFPDNPFVVECFVEPSSSCYSIFLMQWFAPGDIIAVQYTEYGFADSFFFPHGALTRPGSYFSNFGGRLLVTEVPGIGIGYVPEPATWAMLLLGFGAIGHVARRRQARVAVS